MKMAIFRKNLTEILLVCSLMAYFFLRAYQGWPYATLYFKHILDIVKFGRATSYEERVFHEMGPRYLYAKKISEVTPPNAVVCFWTGDHTLDSVVAAYFIYPRVAKEIVVSESLAKEAIKTEGCSYLFLDKGLPGFDLRIKKIYFFGKGLNDTPVVIKTGWYLHKSIENNNNVGLLQL